MGSLKIIGIQSKVDQVETNVESKCKDLESKCKANAKQIRWKANARIWKANVKNASSALKVGQDLESKCEKVGKVEHLSVYPRAQPAYLFPGARDGGHGQGFIWRETIDYWWARDLSGEHLL